MIDYRKTIINSSFSRFAKYNKRVLLLLYSYLSLFKVENTYPISKL